MAGLGVWHGSCDKTITSSQKLEDRPTSQEMSRQSALSRHKSLIGLGVRLLRWSVMFCIAPHIPGVAPGPGEKDCVDVGVEGGSVEVDSPAAGVPIYMHGERRMIQFNYWKY